jgi:hypothetical protein
MPIKLQLPKLGLSLLRQHLIFLSLVSSAALVLAWVSWLTWIDITVWSKDIGAIFFGSRTGEAISLGIGMTVIHYFSIGMLLLALGLVMFLRKRIFAAEPQQALLMRPRKTILNHKKITNHQNSTANVKSEVKSSMNEENAAAREERFFSGCLHHFGYLSSRPKDSPIPQECIICQRLGDCMVATVYVKKID